MEPRLSIITLGVENLERARDFYEKGLGLPMANSQEGIVFFKTSGVCLALYPKDKLAEDIGNSSHANSPKQNSFSGITIAHNTRKKEEVDQILSAAEKAGGKIIKQAQDVFWGGYSGYFSDLDGHLWEVAYADFWQFNDDGSLVID